METSKLVILIIFQMLTLNPELLQITAEISVILNFTYLKLSINCNQIDILLGNFRIRLFKRLLKCKASVGRATHEKPLLKKLLKV